MDSIQAVNLINVSGDETPASTIIEQNRYILYFFSASWCNECQLMLPSLQKIHEEAHKRNIPFEIIYISFDENENDMMENFKTSHGDWFAIPFGSSAIDELKLRYEVTHIPFIVVLKTDGTIITKNGKKELDDLGINVIVTWID